MAGRTILLRFFLDLEDTVFTPYICSTILASPNVATKLADLGGIWVADTSQHSRHLESLQWHLNLEYDVEVAAPFVIAHCRLPGSYGDLAWAVKARASWTVFPEPGEFLAWLEDFVSRTRALLSHHVVLSHGIAPAAPAVETHAGAAAAALAGYRLLIFELEGVLVTRARKLQLRPNVEAFFLSLASLADPPPQVVIASDQSQVGLRLWLESFAAGDPGIATKPTEAEAKSRVQAAVTLLEEVMKRASSEEHHREPAEKSLSWRPFRSLLSFRYRARSGRWGLAPSGRDAEGSWRKDWAKPAAGMIKQAMADVGVPCSKTVVIGAERADQDAANAAGASFVWAADLFGGVAGKRPAAQASSPSAASTPERASTRRQTHHEGQHAHAWKSGVLHGRGRSCDFEGTIDLDEDSDLDNAAPEKMLAMLPVSSGG
eukprot:s6425_g3.t1